jgi:hypothetical protein
MRHKDSVVICRPLVEAAAWAGARGNYWRLTCDGRYLRLTAISTGSGLLARLGLFTAMTSITLGPSLAGGRDTRSTKPQPLVGNAADDVKVAISSRVLRWPDLSR